jgi:hypothetical protein
VFEQKREVPRAVWLNPGLVVERFLPEVIDGMYCLRSWVFMGDQEQLSLRQARTPIVALPNVERRAFIEPSKANLPDSLREQRKDLGFDFGKFDYVIHEGQAHLLDANRTSTNRSMNAQERAATGALLADGVLSMVACQAS